MFESDESLYHLILEKYKNKHFLELYELKEEMSKKYPSSSYLPYVDKLDIDENILQAQIDEKNAIVLFDQAFSELYNNGNTNKAIELYRKIIDEYPSTDTCIKAKEAFIKIGKKHPELNLDIYLSTKISTNINTNKENNYGNNYVFNKYYICDLCKCEATGSFFNKIDNYDICHDCESAQNIVSIKDKNHLQELANQRKFLLKDYYALLDSDTTTTDDDLTKKYNELKSKWNPNNFKKDPELYAHALKIIKEFDEAFNIITCKQRISHSPNDISNNTFNTSQSNKTSSNSQYIKSHFGMSIISIMLSVVASILLFTVSSKGALIGGMIFGQSLFNIRNSIKVDNLVKEGKITEASSKSSTTFLLNIIIILLSLASIIGLLTLYKKTGIYN